jgi:hypothetical protein
MRFPSARMWAPAEAEEVRLIAFGGGVREEKGAPGAVAPGARPGSRNGGLLLLAGYGQRPRPESMLQRENVPGIGSVMPLVVSVISRPPGQALGQIGRPDKEERAPRSRRGKLVQIVANVTPPEQNGQSAAGVTITDSTDRAAGPWYTASMLLPSGSRTYAA